MTDTDHLRRDVREAVAALRERAPLVHCITAAVSMPLVADGLLAAGARPMMTETQAESPHIVTGADALLVNVGTLSEQGARAIPPTVAAAREAGVPWVLDPAAVGRAPVRTPLAQGLLAEAPAVVRANPSETLVLAGQGAGGRGADSVVDTTDAAQAGADLAREHGTVVAVSGASDVITDGEYTCHLHNGDILLTQITGAGCLLGGLCAAYTSLVSPLVAALAATAHLTVAADLALPEAKGPGSFRIALLDALATVTAVDVAERMTLT